LPFLHLFGDTANKIDLRKTDQSEAVSALLNSKLIDWLFRKTSTNNHVMGYEIVQFPIPLKFDEWFTILNVFYFFLNYLQTNRNSKGLVFEQVINSLIFNLYFPDHMKERGIDVLEFVEKDTNEVLQCREFEKLSDIDKEQVIEQLYAKWSHPDNEVRNRIKLFAVRSPEILKPIIES
jgi:hypothetical protein